MTASLTIRDGHVVELVTIGNAEAAQKFCNGVQSASKRANTPFSMAAQGGTPDVVWLSAFGEVEVEKPQLFAIPDGIPLVVTTDAPSTLDRLPRTITERAAALCTIGGTPTNGSTVYLGAARSLDPACIAPELRANGLEAIAEMRFAKLLNRLATHPGARPETPVGYPMAAMVEIVRACNLKCPLCPTGNGLSDHYRNMSVEMFSNIVEILEPTVFCLTLYNYGEPLLHRELPRLIRIAKEQGIEWVELTTNGTILLPGMAEGIVDAGLDMIRFAIDGATQETYEQYRVGGNIDDVWRNLETVVAVRNESGKARPQIEAQMIVNRYNEHEIDAFRERVERAGVDRVRLKTFNALMSGTDHVEEGRRFLPSDTKFSRYADYESLEYRDVYKLSQCEWPWYRTVINADGSVVPCCYDYNGKHRLGSFSINDGKHWWDTDERASFRHRLRTDPMSIDICSRCPFGIPSLDVQSDDM